MDELYLLGVQKVDFIADDGKHVRGYTYWFGEVDDFTVFGVKPFKKFSKEFFEFPESFTFGTRVKVSANLKGVLTSIEII